MPKSRTFRHLKTAQIDIWRPAIETGGGRLVGTAGDAMLAEFNSAVAAVARQSTSRSAWRVQCLPRRQQRMLFRIGVHLGEVIVDQEDQNIFGDGVNLAARIQGIAEPGGIAVSRAVRDITELSIDYAYVDGGEHGSGMSAGRCTSSMCGRLRALLPRRHNGAAGDVRFEGVDYRPKSPFDVALKSG